MRICYDKYYKGWFRVWGFFVEKGEFNLRVF